MRADVCQLGLEPIRLHLSHPFNYLGEFQGFKGKCAFLKITTPNPLFQKYQQRGVPSSLSLPLQFGKRANTRFILKRGDRPSVLGILMAHSHCTYCPHSIYYSPSNQTTQKVFAVQAFQQLSKATVLLPSDLIHKPGYGCWSYIQVWWPTYFLCLSMARKSRNYFLNQL